MSSAARTNLTSNRVALNQYHVIGEGVFRICYAGNYLCGNRNGQEAVCKCFKHQYSGLESDYFRHDFQIADKAIQYAEEWNRFCDSDETILITKGDVHSIGGKKYLVEPLIRYFKKFTSNNGWISEDGGWIVEAMEAFSHFTYYRSGGNLIVCDLQSIIGKHRNTLSYNSVRKGRYKYNKYKPSKSRFELTDVAICSRRCTYGPTDLGEKGIESFFANHVCNGFCSVTGYWQRPRNATQWFPKSSATSMMRSSQSNLLYLNNRSTFRPGFNGILEEDSDEGY